MGNLARMGACCNELEYAMLAKDYWFHDGWIAFENYTVICCKIKPRFNDEKKSHTADMHLLDFFTGKEQLDIRIHIDHCRRLGRTMETGVRWFCPRGYKRILKLKYMPLSHLHTWLFFKLVSCNNPHIRPDCCLGGGGENV